MPCYNEEKTVFNALDMVLAAPLSIKKELIIVNDGSTDDSGNEIRRWMEIHKKDCDIKYFQKENGGKGSAVRMGIQNSGGDVVIIQDADCEYDPCDYENLIQPILKGETQVVYGSRERNAANRSKSSWLFYLGGLSVSLLFNLLYGTSISDEPTCYKTFDGDLIRSLDFKSDGFGWEPEVTAKLLRMGFEIVEVPIEYHPRKVTEGKKIRMRDGIRALLLTFIYRFWSPRKAGRNLAGENNCRIHNANKEFKLSLNLIFVIAVFLRILLSLPVLLGHDESLLSRPDTASYCFDAPGFDWGMRAPLTCAVYYILRCITPYAISFYAWIGIVLSSLIIYPAGYLGYHMSGRKYAGGIIAALLWCFSVTAIGHAPLMLSDTLFSFFVAYQVFFLVRSYFSKRLIDFGYGLGFGTLAALARGVNLPWILAVASVLALFIVRPRWKCIFALAANVMLVVVFLLPFMYLNYARYGVWSLEYNAYNAAVHNGSAVIAHAEGRNSNEVLLELQKKFAQDNPPGTPVEEIIKYNKQFFRDTVKKYPVSFAVTHLPQWQIMLPDVPVVAENLRKSVSGRGTLGVLRQDGLIAAVKHYFAGGGAWIILLLAPFIVLAGFSYFGCVFYLIAAAVNFKKDWMKIILWGALSFYYVVLPGPVVMPRYHLPALIFIFGAAAWSFIRFWEVFKKKKKIFTAE